ncbi:MAG: signal recognition particle protein, partial [Planctomycetes bacterium]|nr:signal recognition particle protein [Planctomycetota bacterium]
DHSRRHRIAKGSGTATHDVNQLLKQFRQMRKTLKHISMQEEAMVAPKHGLAGLMAKRKR